MRAPRPVARGLLSTSIVNHAERAWPREPGSSFEPLERQPMKRLLKKLEAAMVAVAFAEEGEHETARRIMADAGMDQKPERGPKQADRPQGLAPRAPLASGS